MNREVFADWSVPHCRQAPRSPQRTGFPAKPDRVPFTLIGSRRIGKADPPLKASESESMERAPVAALSAREAELGKETAWTIALNCKWRNCGRRTLPRNHRRASVRVIALRTLPGTGVNHVLAVSTSTVMVAPPGTSSTRSPAFKVTPVVGASMPLTLTHQRFMRHSTVQVSPELDQRLWRREIARSSNSMSAPAPPPVRP